MANRPKHLIEYALLRVVIFVVCLLPLRLSLLLIWPLARLSYCFVGKRSREARRRMRSVFGDQVPESTLKQWAWIFNVVEIARAPRMKSEQLADVHDYKEIERCLAYQREHGGFTLTVSHMGNWELAGFVVRMLGLPIFVMMRSQSNLLVSRYLDRVRAFFKVGSIERHSKALGSIIKRIRAGEVFTILPDIRAKEKDSAVLTPFLGGQAYLNAGMALFARHTNTPIFLVILTRKGWVHHDWRVEDPVFPDPALDKEADIARMTAEIMAKIDRAVRAHPEQYFWYNKRWVLDDRF